jgi:hypothetical protein
MDQYHLPIYRYIKLWSLLLGIHCMRMLRTCLIGIALTNWHIGLSLREALQQRSRNHWIVTRGTRVISDHPSPPPPLYSSITSHWCTRPVSEMSTSPNLLGFILVSPYPAKNLRTQPPLLIAYPHPFDPTAQHAKRNIKLGKLSDLRARV